MTQSMTEIWRAQWTNRCPFLYLRERKVISKRCLKCQQATRSRQANTEHNLVQTTLKMRFKQKSLIKFKCRNPSLKLNSNSKPYNQITVGMIMSHPVSRKLTLLLMFWLMSHLRAIVPHKEAIEAKTLMVSGAKGLLSIFKLTLRINTGPNKWAKRFQLHTIITLNKINLNQSHKAVKAWKVTN